MRQDTEQQRYYIGFELHALDKAIGKKTCEVTEQILGDEMPMASSWIIGYLCHETDRPIYQKDIEKRFSLPPSTVTKLVKQLEKDAYIRRVPVENDARLKKLEITDKGKTLHHDIIQTIHRSIDEKLMNGFQDEEKETFLNYIERIRKNVSLI